MPRARVHSARRDEQLLACPRRPVRTARAARARDGSSPTRNLDPRDETALRIAGTWRTRAKVWQAQHGTWANGLRFLRVHSMMDLYCLGLSCRIERLDVRNLSPSGTITTGALADPRPCRLWFQILSESDMDGAVPMLFRAVARTSSLTHLMIDLGDDLLQYSDPGKLLVSITVYPAHLG